MNTRAVLYTESLLPTKRRDFERSVMDNRLYTSIPTFAALIGLAPRAYISGFTSRAPTLQEDHLGEIQERITWVGPCSGDPHSVQHTPFVEFDPDALATALFGLYDKMFYREQVVMGIIGAKFSYAMPLHYTRETIGYLFRVVQSRVKSDWQQVATKFLDYVDRARNYVVGSQYVHDTKFWLHLAGVYTDPPLLETPSPTRSEIFKGWKDVPPVVCVVLTVPRKHLKVLLENKDTTGVPQLEIALKSFQPGGMKHGYASLHCTWGKIIDSPESDIVTLEEDPAGFTGSSDLMVSFWASSRIVGEPDVGVAFALKTSSHSEAVFMNKTASGLVVFAAELNDPLFMRVLGYRPSTGSKVELVELPPITSLSVSSSVKIIPTLGTGPTERHVVSFTGRVDIESPGEREALVGGAEVDANQVSPCTMSLKFGKFEHIVTYPYPIFGESVRLRVARKSAYIEVIVSPSESLEKGGYSFSPTPVIQNNPWNVHHISVDRMPLLNTSDPTKYGWLKAHTALQLSNQENDLMLGKSTSKNLLFAAFADARSTIGTIINQCSGVGGGVVPGRVVSLCESKDGEIYAMFLVGGFRLDLASNTVICDAAVVHPAIGSLVDILGKLPVDDAHPNLQLVTTPEEAAVWKRIIPAFVERSRTWSHGPNCEYSGKGTIPISLEPRASPICACGQGTGFDAPEWKVDSWVGLLPFATRLAISPLFHNGPHSAPKNTISGRVGDTGPRWEFKPRTDKACWVCYGAGKPDLMTCSGCKTARYCSATCQKQDWKSHKKTCGK
ncbi:hypothetical protein FRC09_019634 [Ceratobasidium sp. 395]|nr:hypothetical protein FRC09_019634 [Ceratobasidium sp. 395]